jgi:GNAT superfamily N-acetyltransferase
VSGRPGFSALTQADRERAVATLVSAFLDDPMERWMYPDLAHYMADFPKLIAAFGGAALDLGTAWGLDDCAAVAFWFAPGTQPDGEAIVDVLTETVVPKVQADMFEVLKQMDAAHPREPHWYLPWFGVDPAVQGSGLGSRLMTHCLEVVDASGLPAYVETPNPRTISFYSRHGFEPAGVARAGDFPPMTLMQRPPVL